MSPEQARQFDEIHDHYYQRSCEIRDQYERDLEAARSKREAALTAIEEAQRRDIDDLVHGRPLTPRAAPLPAAPSPEQEGPQWPSPTRPKTS